LSRTQKGAGKVVKQRAMPSNRFARKEENEIQKGSRGCGENVGRGSKRAVNRRKSRLGLGPQEGRKNVIRSYLMKRRTSPRGGCK